MCFGDGSNSFSSKNKGYNRLCVTVTVTSYIYHINNCTILACVAIAKYIAALK